MPKKSEYLLLFIMLGGLSIIAVSVFTHNLLLPKESRQLDILFGKPLHITEVEYQYKNFSKVINTPRDISKLSMALKSMIFHRHGKWHNKFDESLRIQAEDNKELFLILTSVGPYVRVYDPEYNNEYTSKDLFVLTSLWRKEISRKQDIGQTVIIRGHHTRNAGWGLPHAEVENKQSPDAGEPEAKQGE